MNDQTLEHLEPLIEAITKVNPAYVLKSTNDSDDLKVPQLERVFAYELYHQCRDCFYKKFPQLIISPEIAKQLSLQDKNKQVYPDLVFHGGDNDVNNQWFCCEIKRYVSKNNPSTVRIRNDINKLSNYLSLKAPDGRDAKFDLAIFIVINCDLESLKQRISRVLIKSKKICVPSANLDKIICMSVHEVDQKLTADYFKLSACNKITNKKS